MPEPPQTPALPSELPLLPLRGAVVLPPTVAPARTPEPPHPPALPSDLPVLPLRGAVVLPLTVAPLGVSRPLSVEAVNRALASDRLVFLLLQRSDADDPSPDDLHRIGT